MRAFEYLINDMVFDIKLLRASFADHLKLYSPVGYCAVALLANDTENHRYVPIVDGWLQWAEYYDYKGVIVPRQRFDHKTRMIAGTKSPIWQGIGIGTFDAEPFAFAAHLGIRFSLSMVDYDTLERLKKGAQTHPGDTAPGESPS